MPRSKICCFPLNFNCFFFSVRLSILQTHSFTVKNDEKLRFVPLPFWSMLISFILVFFLFVLPYSGVNDYLLRSEFFPPGTRSHNDSDMT